MQTIAGIRRQSLYSPNHIENDTKILMRTAEHLIDMGVIVKIYEEQDLGSIEINESVIFSMAQGERSLDELLKLQNEGRLIINTPQAAKKCFRMNMVNILPQNKIPFPKSYVLPVDNKNGISFDDFNARKIWVKRGDVHAVHREDVTLVYSEEERKNIFREFNKRGIEYAVLQEHLEGDVIKFYSIKSSSFFHWYYLNGINHTPFNKELLVELASRSAEILGLDIYGGDAIISPDGSISIIDINDWPSFAPIREQSSKEIAQLIFQKAKYFEETILLKS
jgi:glutathione synthase/RimK-type ligase-like ATP-grasp enzyme